MIKFIYGILPYTLNYTNSGLQGWEAGRVDFLSIKIKPQYKDDQSLLAHELEHVKQVYKTCFMHSILYALSRHYRLRAECAAYIAGQIIHGTKSVDQVVDDLFNNYNLKFSKSYIKSTLRDKLAQLV